MTAEYKQFSQNKIGLLWHLHLEILRHLSFTIVQILNFVVNFKPVVIFCEKNLNQKRTFSENQHFEPNRVYRSATERVFEKVQNQPSLLYSMTSGIPEELVEEVGDLAVVENDDARHVTNGSQQTNHRLQKI